MGVEFGSKTVDVNDEKVKLQIWDTVRFFFTMIGRAGDLQVHHSLILSRVHRCYSCVRYHQQGLVQKRIKMAGRDEEFCQRENLCHLGRKQERSRRTVHFFLFLEDKSLTTREKGLLMNITCFLSNVLLRTTKSPSLYFTNLQGKFYTKYQTK